jgi:hypothetical protein
MSQAVTKQRWPPSVIPLQLIDGVICLVQQLLDLHNEMGARVPPLLDIDGERRLDPVLDGLELVLCRKVGLDLLLGLQSQERSTNKMPLKCAQPGLSSIRRIRLSETRH